MKDQWNYVDIPLRQHIGKPSKPVVSVGDKVVRGQLIAERDGLGANIHASVYGTVESVGDSIKIAMDAEQPEEFAKIPQTDTHLEAIEAAGVVGAGGAGFPVHVKLNVNLEGGHFIVNAAECEPGLLHNMQMLENDAAMVVKALGICMGITNASKGYIAIKAKNTKAKAALSAACAGLDISIHHLPDSYPSGDERFIIREILGAELQPGDLPSSVGAVVSNAETMKRIYEAINLRKPVISKDLTVNGRVVGLVGQKKGRVFLDVPIGTPIRKLIEECGGYQEPHGELVLGGAFTGKGNTDAAVLTKVLGGVFVSMPFPNDARKFGILACECGADGDRLRTIVAGMGGNVVSEDHCKRMEPDKTGRLRCTKPGQCPGQAEKIIKLKKDGAQAILVGTCED